MHAAPPAAEQMLPRAAQASAESAKYDYIDALRGYAILLVIVVHVGSAFPELPFPVKRFTNLGWYGVQLFFVVSSLTLAMSWHARPAESFRSARFLIRRFFRIAPMYYVATAYYFIARPPGESFSLQQLLASTLFAHGWSPGFLPTTSESWTVVPGSWSVAAEFGFYLLFPLLLLYLSSFTRAALALVGSLAAAYLANRLGFSFYIDSYGFVATDQFLFFWLPNQLPVFLSGLVLYYALRRAQASPGAPIGKDFLRRNVHLIVGCGALAVLAVPFLSIPRLPLVAFPFVPVHVLVGLVFCAVTAALAVTQRHFLVNRPAVWLGRVSFSAYVLHFTVIPTLAGAFPALFNTRAGGVPAIMHYAALLCAAVLATFLVSWVTYRLVELPMIALGRRACGLFARPKQPPAALGSVASS